MKFSSYRKNLFLILTLLNVVFCEISFLDRFAHIFRATKEAFGSSTKNLERTLKVNKSNNKLQPRFLENERFFCDVESGARSKIPPSSVHKLKPGDVDIVGAIGDSLTAGNGAFAVDALGLLDEGRGVSWSIGGQATWKDYLTLPNILKVYNKNLYGYSINEYSYSYEKSSMFNVAEAGAMTKDTPHQARNLVKRMRSDKNVNIAKHWKLVTYMIGGNDFCLDICYYNDQNRVIDRAANDIILALRILKENLPRTLVSVVLPPDPSVLYRINRPNECKSLNYFECPCFFSLSHSKNRQRTLATVQNWKQRIENIVKMSEFHNTNDFEVTLHTFLDKLEIPDLSYMSTDCFHLSQKGHATMAINLWNSMLTSDNKRLRYLKFQREFEEFKCPTSNFPFLATTKNS